MISSEPDNSDERYKFDTYKNFVLKENQTTEKYEETVKDLFIEEPANMKLLIVVDKLLTGFDAPSCTYLYIDKSRFNESKYLNLFKQTDSTVSLKELEILSGKYLTAI